MLLNTLAYHGKPETIPILAKLLKRKGFIRSRRQKSFQKEIVNHLGAFPRHTSEPLLNAIIKGRDRTQSQLAKSSSIRTAIKRWVEMNRSDDKYLQLFIRQITAAAANASLYQLEHPQVLKLCLKALDQLKVY